MEVVLVVFLLAKMGNLNFSIPPPPPQPPAVFTMNVTSWEIK